MPDALRIGPLGPLQVRDETGRLIHVGGRQLPVLLTLLALNAGRVVPAGSLAGRSGRVGLPHIDILRHPGKPGGVGGKLPQADPAIGASREEAADLIVLRCGDG